MRRHSRRLSFPTWPCNEIVACLRTCGARADIGEVGAVMWIGELHAVVTAIHVWNVQDLRPLGEIKPAADVEHVVAPRCH